MRISDWSSDVCSSDLLLIGSDPFGEHADLAVGGRDAGEVEVEHARVEEVLHELLPVAGELAHDPEVEVAAAAVVEHPDVAGVHVAVERAMDHTGLGPALGTAPQPVLAGTAPLGEHAEAEERRQVADGESVSEQDEHV